MALIDPEGMFGGERMALLSDDAKLAWPWLWCASNTFGRLELDYSKIVALAFRQFREKPSEERFWGWIREFHDAFLLFVYESEGLLLGQWDTSEKFLPRYKTHKDKAKTPPPNVHDLTKWKDGYLQSKKLKAQANMTVSMSKCNGFTNSENFPKVSETSTKFPVGIGIGIGIGKGGGIVEVPTAPPPPKIAHPAELPPPVRGGSAAVSLKEQEVAAACEVVTHRLGSPMTSGILDAILQALGPAPVSLFSDRIKERGQDAKKLGFLIELAKDACEQSRSGTRKPPKAFDPLGEKDYVPSWRMA